MRTKLLFLRWMLPPCTARTLCRLLAEMYAGSEGVTEARDTSGSLTSYPIQSRQGHLRRPIRFTAYPTLMSSDLALQIGSLIGVSALLYLVTTPRKDLLDQVEEPALSGMRK
jgi:hypothetical protein